MSNELPNYSQQTMKYFDLKNLGRKLTKKEIDSLDWFDNLVTSETLKIKFKSKYIPIPGPQFRQGRKFAIESVGIDTDVFRGNNPVKGIVQTVKAIQNNMQTFLQSYVESVSPETIKNPTAKKIEAAFKVMDQLTNSEADGGVMQKWFPDKSAAERKQLASALKGAIMVITHIYTEGNAKLTKEKFGYKEGQGQNEQQDVQFARLMRAAVGFLTMSLVEKLYGLDAKDIAVILRSEIPREELASFWRDPKQSDLFFRRLKDRARTTLGRIDLLDALKI